MEERATITPWASMPAAVEPHLDKMKIEPETRDGARGQMSSAAEASQQLPSDVGSVMSGREAGKGGMLDAKDWAPPDGHDYFSCLRLRLASVCRSCSSPSPAVSIPPCPFPLGRDASTVQSTVSCPSGFVLDHRSTCLLITRASTTWILLHT